MPTQKPVVRLTNLTSVLRSLRRIAPEAHQELKAASGGIAGRVVCEGKQDARTRHQSAKAAESLRAAKGDTPTVKLGSNLYPFAMGAEFGGQRRSTTMQFPPWRGSSTGAGYFLWPTVRLLRDWIDDAYMDALDEALTSAGAD